MPNYKMNDLPSLLPPDLELLFKTKARSRMVKHFSNHSMQLVIQTLLNGLNLGFKITDLAMLSETSKSRLNLYKVDSSVDWK
jgi:hypothetical protein